MASPIATLDQIRGAMAAMEIANLPGLVYAHINTPKVLHTGGYPQTLRWVDGGNYRWMGKSGGGSIMTPGGRTRNHRIVVMLAVGSLEDQDATPGGLEDLAIPWIDAFDSVYTASTRLSGHFTDPTVEALQVQVLEYSFMDRKLNDTTHWGPAFLVEAVSNPNVTIHV